MPFQILGTLRVVGDDVADAPSAHKVKTLLATLLIRANQVVSADQLLAELWGDDPPRRALAGLHVYVSQLRKFLAGVLPGPDRVVTRAPGYLIRVDADEVDLLVFRRLVHQGRNYVRAGRHEEAAGAFAEALELSRESVLDDLREGAIVTRFATWVEELRLECTEMFVECNFTLGRHRELVGFLHELVAEHPLHEAFHRQLMLALYRSDRRADALGVYQAARDTITSELGLEPCRAMRELHHAILLGEDERLAV
ncbi:AfsR/SARP family transcriptional regulator [Saccharothrix syringae]|uniref:Activator protein n=1 Tax=Saccharothrix syringae TaxID=103733 RepID=A0A5Q0H0B8_SACSY|nr:AfsR/SARP family transcriptional regulator [Saccharothrix syringae]QFZ19210.1 activator protein [Saccharothrix syringae]